MAISLLPGIDRHVAAEEIERFLADAEAAGCELVEPSGVRG
jgi:hypothetical protein